MEANGHRYAPVPGKIAGTAKNLGGVDFVIPPLNLDGVQEVMPLLKTFETLTKVEEIIPAAAKVVLIALKRNYPDLTYEELLPLIDVGNANDAVLSIVTGSGFALRPAGESRPASP